MVDGALIGAEDIATVDVRNLSLEAARPLLETLLKERGFELERQAGITYVRRIERPEEAQRVLVYRPKFRSVAYLQGAVRSFVPRGRFAGSGLAEAGGSAAPAAGGGSTVTASPGGAVAAPQNYSQSAVTGVVPAQGAVLASQDVMVFEGTEPDVAKVQDLVAQLDQPAQEVLVRAYVFEVGSSASDGSAVAIALNLLGGKLTGTSPAASLPYGVGVHVAGIDAAYAVLQSDSRFRVLSSPTLRIKSGEHGKLSVGSEVPVLGAVSLSSTGQPVQSVEYRSSGVILDLRPEVLLQTVNLVVQQQVSSFVETTTGVNGSPTLLKRDLTTTLALKSGEVAVIGGLEEQRDGNGRSGLPGFLSFIGSRSREDTRSELILLLEAAIGATY